VQENVCLKIIHSSIMNILVALNYKKKAQNVAMLAHSALRISLRTVARAQNIQMCYEIILICLLPFAAVLLLH
jgi:hypothetical protein